MNLKTLIPALLLLLPAAHAVDIQRWRTPEGTQILLVERRDNPIVDMEITFKGAGSASNPKGKSQVAEFTAALLTDGTKTLDEEAFKAKTNDLAVYLSSGSDRESASVSLRSLSRPAPLKEAAALLNQSLTQPRFEEHVFRRRQSQAVTALQQMETTPDFTAGRAFTRLAYPNHPYGGSAQTTVDSLKNVTPDDIRAFHRAHYGRDNAVVAIVGDINRRRAERLVRAALKDLPAHAAAPNIPPVPAQPAAQQNIPFAGEQAKVILGLPLITRKDPDYYALVAGNYILGGGGFDSRLMKQLRDRKGYTYGVHSSLDPAGEAGPFTVSFATQKKNTRAALDDTRAVIRQFIAEGPTEAELQQAKDNIVGSFPLRFDSNAKLLGYLSLIGEYGLPDDYLEAYPKAIAALTVEQVREAWQRRVNPDALHIVVVGAE
ncbi:M16 family metallopeptidase [Bergeriella denitrificans]|uniref:Peptidase M16 inactive domain n=1 Tax=Bergeriella denitrificans TaxID=494 RepID=A0A378ULI2_BERDE|nr:pitrilysin family protein [Bergeriella denitrificans]STZ77332.1 Peptidase M16 inactive domain [Bergeriella denitrificans]